MLNRFVCTSPRVTVLSVGKAGTGLGLRTSALGVASVRQFRAGPITRFEKSSPAQNAAGAATVEKTQSGEHKSKVHGSYHWDLERGLSALTLPLIGGAFVVGPNPYIDLALGVVIPLHCHIGFDACIIDYFDYRKAPVVNRIMKGALYLTTAGVLYGCYQFNTNDVGITEGVKRIWTGKV
ncbi:membrane anchor subunit of succinate dehydrogenase, Sdh4 [Rhizophlyctis rosea]|nr:membrane anchor subunit of succinate dehydrogenase, Sdh4 [Rhizophlyctis rosea]